MRTGDLQKAAKLTKLAYTQGYDGEALKLPEEMVSTVIEHCEYQHSLGSLHKSTDKKSDYWTPYGGGLHG